ncbi:HNH endonuclease signature motif containing protein [Frankia sp. ArI3]|uniref:HNH endonuclease signature motif containing protein n=2 Tax=unclassified Frankia TaxID=2632575 RepID=UPI002102153E|nr:HNH endonuclease signature motif containing protein [Frankia sp. ArI3]
MVFDDDLGDGPDPPARLATISRHLDGLLAAQAWQLSDGELAGLIEGMCRLTGRVAAARGLLFVEAQDRGFAVRHGATDLAGWLRDRLRLTTRDARRQVTLAHDTTTMCTATGTALAEGTITVEQAVVICDAIRTLPTDVTGEQRAAAEQALIGFADQFDPYHLVKLAARLRETLTTIDTSPGGDDPPTDNHTKPRSGKTDSGGSGGTGDTASGDGDSGADSGDGGREKPSPDPADIRRLTLTDTPAGTTLINGELDAEGAALLRTALDSLAAPQPTNDTTPDRRNPARRRADALLDLITRALSAAAVPASGGVRPHLTVTIDGNTLLASGTNPALTSWGLPLPHSTLTRLSCDAEISRIILDPASVPLDIGRSTRVVPPHLRRALAARDRGCTFPGCDRPPSWCEAHHVIHWTHSGITALHNLVLLCGHHHRQVHHDGWTILFTDTGHPAYIPPWRIDPAQRPRQNPYTHPPDLLTSVT